MSLPRTDVNFTGEYPLPVSLAKIPNPKRDSQVSKEDRTPGEVRTFTQEEIESYIQSKKN